MGFCNFFYNNNNKKCRHSAGNMSDFIKKCRINDT